VSPEVTELKKKKKLFERLTMFLLSLLEKREMGFFYKHTFHIYITQNKAP